MIRDDETSCDAFFGYLPELGRENLDVYLGRVVSRVMNRKGMPEKFVADSVNISLKDFRAMLRGERGFKSDELHLICVLVGITGEKIFRKLTEEEIRRRYGEKYRRQLSPEEEGLMYDSLTLELYQYLEKR